MTLKLIPDWRLAWKFLSVQASVLLALLSGIQADVLPIVSPLFPAERWPYVSGGIALAIVVLRLLAQDGLAQDRAQLELDRLDAEAGATTDVNNPIQAGRFERYLGAVAGLIIAVVLLSLLGLLWSLR